MECNHNFVERETSVYLGGLCPLCLAAENTRLRENISFSLGRLETALAAQDLVIIKSHINESKKYLQ